MWGLFGTLGQPCLQDMGLSLSHCEQLTRASLSTSNGMSIFFVLGSTSDDRRRRPSGQFVVLAATRWLFNISFWFLGWLLMAAVTALWALFSTQAISNERW